MAEPITRAEFKEYCLRRLGKPVIEINVADSQVDDRIQDAINYYYRFHFDGTEKLYYKHEIQEEDKENGYITLPENIVGAVKVFNSNAYSGSTSQFFDVKYQLVLNDLYSLTNRSLVPYFMNMQYLSLMESILVGTKPMRYNRNLDKLYIDTNWELYNEGEFLLIEAYQVVDPETYPDVWADHWLKEYATALIKKQWGENLGKYQSIPLPGGLSINGDRLWNQAENDVRRLENDMIRSYSEPLGIYIG